MGSECCSPERERMVDTRGREEEMEGRKQEFTALMLMACCLRVPCKIGFSHPHHRKINW